MIPVKSVSGESLESNTTRFLQIHGLCALKREVFLLFKLIIGGVICFADEILIVVLESF